MRAAALDVAPLNATCASDIVMIDEVCHFVNGKKTKYGFGDTGVSHRPLGWELSHRGDASAKKLISRIDIGTCSFVTDEWGSFFRLLPEGRHFYGKDLNFPIKGTNSGIRHRLARFHRRSKTTSRSSEMGPRTFNFLILVI